MATALTTLHGAATLLDNHKLIDPVEAQFPRTHPEYQTKRQVYRRATLDEFVVNTATLSRLVIFTGEDALHSLSLTARKLIRHQIFNRTTSSVGRWPWSTETLLGALVVHSALSI